MTAYARPNHSEIMALATSRAEDCPECRCKHSPLPQGTRPLSAPRAA